MRLGVFGFTAAVLLSRALGQGDAPTTNRQTPPSVPTGPTHTQTPLGALTPDDDGDDGWRASLSLPCPQATPQTGVTIDRVLGAHRCRGIFFVPQPTVATPTARLMVVSPITGPTVAATTPSATDAILAARPTAAGPTARPTEAAQTTTWVHGSTMLSWGSARGIGGIGVCAMAIASIGALAALELLVDNDNDNDNDDGDAAPKGGAYSGESNPPQLPPVIERGDDPHEELNHPQLLLATERGDDPHEELNHPQLLLATERGDSPQEDLNPPPLLLATERGDDPHEELNHPQLLLATERGDGPQEEPNPPPLLPTVESDDQLEENDDQSVDVTPTRVTKQVPVAIEPLPIADTPTPAPVDGQALVASIDEQVSSNSAPTQTPVDNPPDDPVLSGTTPIQEPVATKTGKTIDSSAASSAPTQPVASSASDKGMKPECAGANKASSSSSSSGTFGALEPVTQPGEPVEETGTTEQAPVIAKTNLPVSGSFTFGTPTPPLFNMGSSGSNNKGKRFRDIAKPKSQLSSSSSKVTASVTTQPATTPAPVATKTSKTVDDSAADS
ncbi:hypothetical protein GGI09_008155, partial [Coemansia sp. S100]